MDGQLCTGEGKHPMIGFHLGHLWDLRGYLHAKHDRFVHYTLNSNMILVAVLKSHYQASLLNFCVIYYTIIYQLDCQRILTLLISF